MERMSKISIINIVIEHIEFHFLLTEMQLCTLIFWNCIYSSITLNKV